jgi:hypothetical protein
MKKIRHIVVILILSTFLGCNDRIVEIKVFGDQIILEELAYGFQKLEHELAKESCKLIFTSNVEDANLVLDIKGQTDLDSEKNDGFALSKTNKLLHLSSECNRGLLFGVLDITEQLSQGASWGDIKEKSITAHHDFRAIKFNLPWYSYRSGENLSLHMETCKDLAYWESFLEMMVENKFNALTLWNMHPYMYMVKSRTYPKASPFSDAEMAEWEVFWKNLFKMAKDRGIDTYIVNWNIFLPEAFSKEYGGANYSSETGASFIGDGETNKEVEEYSREMVTLTLNKYENLTGIGISLGERMGGMDSEQRKDWVDRTLIAGLKAADRKARLIYRAPLSAGLNNGGSVSVTTEKITRDAIENLGLEDDVWIEFKYNWSHAHSSPKLSIVHGGMLTDTYWEPYSTKYKGVWTMRNEDFFVMRWANTEFIRSFLDFNSQKYIGGCIIGSETYIPAKDYFTKEEYHSWNYAFERQWLFYKVWGNLLYNSATPDSYFANALAKKFNFEDGSLLLEAWQLASKNPNRFASFHGGTWDATIYSEAFTTNGGKFIDINDFIDHPVLDSSYVNIPDFIAGNYDEVKQITPLQLAEETENESQKLLGIVDAIRDENISNELEIELTDVEFWANYGLYFASKIRAGVALESFRKGLDKTKQNEAVDFLIKGNEYWMKMVELAERFNVASMPHQFDKDFSWRKHIVDVENDIAIAQGKNVKADPKL